MGGLCGKSINKSFSFFFLFFFFCVCVCEGMDVLQ